LPFDPGTEPAARPRSPALTAHTTTSSATWVTSREGTETMQALIVGRDITGVGTFT
jgi:hypothetical protein